VDRKTESAAIVPLCCIGRSGRGGIGPGLDGEGDGDLLGGGWRVFGGGEALFAAEGVAGWVGAGAGGACGTAEGGGRGASAFGVRKLA